MFEIVRCPRITVPCLCSRNIENESYTHVKERLYRKLNTKSVHHPHEAGNKGLPSHPV